MSCHLFFLHGFLGLPEDWNATVQYLTQKLQTQIKQKLVFFHLVDYMNHPNLGPHHRFENWGENFNSFALKTIGSDEFKKSKNILIGYSLGGRLGLHAFFNSPHFWDHLICISTHPGMNLSTPLVERTQRYNNDSQWAIRFLKDDFDQVVHDWNQQSVLKSLSVSRSKSSFDIKSLSLALTQWSLSKQKDFSTLIQQQLINKNKKMDWIAGTQDEKFMNLAQELKSLSPNLNFSSIESSGHRVLFENPKHLSELILKTILNFL